MNAPPPGRILLAAPIHRWPAYFDEANEDCPYPRWQVQSSWVRALRQIGCDVACFPYSESLAINRRTRSWLKRLPADTLRRIVRSRLGERVLLNIAARGWDRPYRARQFYSLVEKFHPEILLVDGGPSMDVLGSEVFEALRRRSPAVQLVLLHGMDPVRHATETEKRLIREWDAIVTNDETFANGWRSLGARKVLTLPISAADPTFMMEEPLSETDRKRYGSEVSFIGSLWPEDMYGDRVALLNEIADFNLAVWTPHPGQLKRYPKLARCFRGSALGPDVATIYRASKIGINIHGSWMPQGANMRTFEIPSYRCLQMIDHTLPNLFSSEEAVYFDDAHDLREKITFYLSHPAERQAIAEAGRKRVLSDHTYAHRFQKLLRELSER